MQLRRWVVGAVATVVVVGGAVVFLWRAQVPAQVSPGSTVSLRDGQVTFRVPKGWRREGCPAPDSGCVILRPPGGAPSSGTTPNGVAGDLGDVVTVIVMTPDPHAPEADLSRLLLVLDPAALSAGGDVSYFIIDGVRFARTHTDARTSPVEQPARTLVLGVLPNNDDVRVLCEERAKPDLVRAGCQVVIDSLHVRT